MILGHGRSGSSIIERMLGGDAGFVNIGELRDLITWGVQRANCRCGASVIDCEFWRQVGDDALGDWSSVSTQWLFDFFHTHLRYPDVPFLRRRLHSAELVDEARRYAATFESLYRAIADREGSRVIVDTSKHLGQLICLAEHTDVDLRVLHLVRDPRGNAYSWRKTGIDLSPIGRPNLIMRTISPRNTAIGWAVRNFMIERFVPSTIPYERIRYEDFAADPTAVLDGALSRLKVEPLPNWSHVHGRVVELPHDHAFGGNPGVAQRREATITADEEWRTNLPPAERRLVTALALPMMLRYRYPLLSRPTTRPAP
jgi:hypothetical protein